MFLKMRWQWHYRKWISIVNELALQASEQVISQASASIFKGLSVSSHKPFCIVLTKVMVLFSFSYWTFILMAFLIQNLLVTGGHKLLHKNGASKISRRSILQPASKPATGHKNWDSRSWTKWLISSIRTNQTWLQKCDRVRKVSHCWRYVWISRNRRYNLTIMLLCILILLFQVIWLCSICKLICFTGKIYDLGGQVLAANSAPVIFHLAKETGSDLEEMDSHKLALIDASSGEIQDIKIADDYVSVISLTLELQVGFLLRI